ncbi:MAG TPA: hypothetical protein VE153_23275 [Myxococcus sp.]|nr:hypothetical protein [Myxococcus sp.]
MRSLIRRLSLVGAVLLTGCGGVRQRLAEEAYLQQQLYDYAYDVPLERLWAEAKAITGARGNGEVAEDGVRTLSIPALAPDAPLLQLRGWTSEGRSHLHILRVYEGAWASRPEDAGARVVDLELKLLERFHPEAARRFQDGARLAGARAR